MALASGAEFARLRGMIRTDAALVALRRILRATDSHGRDLARAAGLTPVQARVLGLLAAAGAMSQRCLADQLRVAQATVSSLIDRLQSKGLVQRDRSERDRRQILLTLTQAGHAALERAPDPLHDRFVARFEAMTEVEQAAIVAALERVAHLLDAEKLDAAPMLDGGELHRPRADLADPAQ